MYCISGTLITRLRNSQASFCISEHEGERRSHLPLPASHGAGGRLPTSWVEPGLLPSYSIDIALLDVFAWLAALH